MESFSKIVEEYHKKHSKSRILYERALKCFPSGVTHDNRYNIPFPIYAEKALGSKKWDVDGNEYVDYIMGHGSLLFGYGYSKILEKIQEQVAKAIHIGSCTEQEIKWAELIQKLVPCAKNGFVRATACGSEAIQLAIRLARAYTGNSKVILHAGSYHGTSDMVQLAYNGPPFGIRNSKGIPESIKKDAIIVSVNELEKIESLLMKGDIACILLQCNSLYTKDYIRSLRKLTENYGSLLIMDEVVSGFRYSKGGAQEYYNVIPDIAVLGKIVGGGFPIGAICGKREILEFFSFKDEYWNKFIRISIGGTWNAHPVSIVGGIATMEMILEESDKIYKRIYLTGKKLVKSFNDYINDLKVTAIAYGLPNDNPTIVIINFFKKEFPPDKMYIWENGCKTLEDYNLIQDYLAGSIADQINWVIMTNNGVLAMNHNRQYMLCTAHNDEDLAKTEEAFFESLKILKENDIIGSK